MTWGGEGLYGRPRPFPTPLAPTDQSASYPSPLLRVMPIGDPLWSPSHSRIHFSPSHRNPPLTKNTLSTSAEYPPQVDQTNPPAHPAGKAAQNHPLKTPCAAAPHKTSPARANNARHHNPCGQLY